MGPAAYPGAPLPGYRWQPVFIRKLVYCPIGQIVGGLTIAAGLCGAIYTLTNFRADRNNLWEMLRSLFDVGFGVAFIVYSQGSLERFMGVLGFWAIMYGFLESVQAMYNFMLSGVGHTTSYFPVFFHFAAVLIAGALAYLLVLTPSFVHSLSTLVGLFPILLGGIIIVLAFQQKKEAQLANRAM